MSKKWYLLFVYTVVLSVYAAPWLTYVDHHHDFKIKYPATALIKRGFDSYYLMGKSWRYGADGKTGRAVLSISLPTKTKADSADIAVRIGVSDNDADIANCLAGSTGHKRINGVMFSTVPFADTAMSKTLQGVSYRAVYQQHCYAIEQVLTYSVASIDNAAERQAVIDQLEKSYRQLETVVKTFKFLK